MSARGRGRPEYLWAVVAGVAITLALVVAFLAFGGDDAPETSPGAEAVLGATNAGPPPDAAEATDEHASDLPRRDRRRVRRALQVGVERAAALGGSVHAAAMSSGWRAPAVVASDPANGDEGMRLWSTSKVLTAVALLRHAGWGDRPGEALSREVEDALTGALVRSENCRQRRVVLELQRAAGGASEVLTELAEIAAVAEAHVELGSDVEPPQPMCQAFLETQQGIAEPLGPALLLGTSTWRMVDAARFAHALAAGRYGDALGDRVLELMRLPKQPSRETPPGDYTAAPDWGAGRALAGFTPAYKAGWGGTLLDDFFVTQLAALELEGGGVVSLAVAFHPDLQPPKDDPGLTPGPEAVEAVMEAVRGELGRLGG